MEEVPGSIGSILLQPPRKSLIVSVNRGLANGEPA